MDCLDPHTTRTVAHRCGRCANCRRYQGRVWAHRISLERTQHVESCFVTLTYDPVNHERVRGSLNPTDTRNFLKRLRFALAPRSIRYFLVGEYGGQTRRPHYHLAVFGIGVGTYEVIRKAWGFGFVYVAPLDPKCISYISAYLVKKQSYLDSEWYTKVYPCFIRVSTGRKSGCGLGGDATWDIASEVMRWDLSYPFAIRHGRFFRPLGRYLTELIRVRTGQEKREFSADAELQALRAFAWRHDRSVRSVYAEYHARPGCYHRETL